MNQSKAKDSSTHPSSANPATIPTSISRTALDSLHAKLSAIEGGWLDGNEVYGGIDGDDGGGSHSPVTRRNDTAIVGGPIKDYCALLRRVRDGVEGGRRSNGRRRQTPLVNAGYAARVAVVTFVLERWLAGVLAASSCSTSTGRDDKEGDDDGTRRATNPRAVECVNVVMLGCGMDASGPWAKKMARDDALRQSSQASDRGVGWASPKVKVYEFDAWDNCVLKRQALLDSGMLRECRSLENADGNGNIDRSNRQSEANSATANPDPNPESSFHTLSKGKIMLDDDIGSEHDQNDEDDYFLVALDLRETHPSSNAEVDAIKRKSILSQAILHSGIQISQPTIVLSELVIAYLGNDGADATMHSIATDVLRGNGRSMFACLEPVFPIESVTRRGAERHNARPIPVEEGYSLDYGRQFLSKLQRGESKQRPTKSDPDAEDRSASWLHPLGANLREVRTRLERCGFSPTDNTRCASLGNAAAHVARTRRSAGAPGFLRANEPFDEGAALALNANCYGVACAFSPASGAPEGWAEGICPWGAAKDRRGVASSSVEIRPVASLPEDGQIRDLYGKIYLHLYDEYPAIRKMVKAALKMDLRVRPTDIGERSVIRNRFTDKGGEFWVAKDTADSRVMGCVGVRQRKKREADDTQPTASPSVVVEYEIQRLAVDDCHRGKGIGKKFLRVVEEYTRCQQSRIENESTSVTIKLWAITPECLIAANKLYETVGYKKEETFRAGSLCMNVYCKSLQC